MGDAPVKKERWTRLVRRWLKVKVRRRRKMERARYWMQ